MAEQVFYMRGVQRPPFRALVRDSGFREDLKAFASLSDGQADSLRKRLSEAKGFLDPKLLLATIREVIKDENTARSARRLLRNLEPKDVDPLGEALSESRDEDEDFPFDERELNRLLQILPALIQPYPALTRFEKAERLAKVTGQELESIELICDLRPIFDGDRKEIEGMMPYTRLRVVATGEDGLPNSFEVELTQQQVHDLVEKAEKAKSKLDVLRQFVERWIPGGLPDLPLTRVPRKESSDG